MGTWLSCLCPSGTCWEESELVSQKQQAGPAAPHRAQAQRIQQARHSLLGAKGDNKRRGFRGKQDNLRSTGSSESRPGKGNRTAVERGRVRTPVLDPRAAARSAQEAPLAQAEAGGARAGAAG